MNKEVDLKKAPRYCGISTFMNQPYTKDVTGADVAVIGIPFEMGTAPGNIFAPKEIRHVSWLLRSTSPLHMVDIWKELNIVDYGDMTVFTGDWEQSFPLIEKELEAILEKGVVPICMGGCHSVTYPQLRAYHKFYPDIALIQLDAHTDTHDVYFGKQKYTSGSVVRRAIEDGLVDPQSSIQVGIRGTMYSPGDIKQSQDLGIEVVTTDEVAEMGVAKTVEKIRRRVGNKKVFLTFDMDVVDPAFAPGTARAEPGGITSREVLGILKGLAGLEFIGFDTAEINPSHDCANLTTILGANIIFEFMALIAMYKKQKN
ncbi:agmatinase [Youxingia wuxianensis]|uniref:Agmatinase n=1 Tax=Youxingia wuxianensis TaxID=2763678 RepID=A0A926EQ75_9FIRM|nr:agmatinase [Youxingia wuxianensis]MBC8586505.1 agmatinase [Youxingia wuxianensis]